MKFDQIQHEWEKDSKIDKTELGDESIKIPQLHSKYFKIYSEEKGRFTGLQHEYHKLYRLKYEYFAGTISEEKLSEKGWDPQPLKIIRQDIPMYLNSDDDIVLIKQKIELQEQKLEYLESIIKSLSNRGFQIKTAVDWIKFTQGL